MPNMHNPSQLSDLLIIDQLTQEMTLPRAALETTIQLLDDGASVPFIARYRKEQTGSMSDTQLRQLEQRLAYLRQLLERKNVILKSIEEQGQLTPELKTRIIAATTLTEAEDLYLPYKPKRRTKAQIAKEAGLLPLAQMLLSDPTQEPKQAAAAFIHTDLGFNDVKAVLDGARYIITEQWSEDAALLGQLRHLLQEKGIIISQAVDGKQEEGKKFSDYFDFKEPLKQIKPHRALALFRGRREGVLQLTIDLPIQETAIPHEAKSCIMQYASIQDQGRAADNWLIETVDWAWKTKLHHQLMLDLFTELRETAETQAIHVFAQNLRDLLLAAPAGMRVAMGVDPGIRTGIKIAIVDNTGHLLQHTTLYPHAPKNQWQETITALAALAREYHVDLISIGNGTASRETERLISELISQHADLKLTKVIVSEAGASVYSASELAAQEFPSIDVTIRGAISIARRLQDPLAELVKIEPKAIGVGQYQHDVNQTQLNHSLTHVVEDCVNTVGVDLNTASAELLSYVSGLNQRMAKNIIVFRQEHGAFQDRKMLLKVSHLGDKAFEQAAGFLRIRDGANPLDASAVHPEAYPVVEKICQHLQVDLKSLIGNKDLLTNLDPTLFTDDRFGLPTVIDIIKELEKPGRDPRPHFRTAQLKEGVNTLADLKPGMILEGTVSNLTDFGAFVDIGVHQDGLVHLSQLADRFVKDVRSVVKVGDIVTVKVMEVDTTRKRISLTMRLEEKAKPESQVKKGPIQTQTNKSRPEKSREKIKPKKSAFEKPLDNPIMADALKAALGKLG